MTSAPGLLAWVTASNHSGDMKNPPLGADFFCLLTAGPGDWPGRRD
ncbi:TPA: hypothetical protein MFN45_001995 [Klebsiella pneumoniae]|nr:hypothetical protein [Klebsiella pneumoniae]HBW8905549.1 hypothetical protein [Klebsiella pneumoniae]